MTDPLVDRAKEAHFRSAKAASIVGRNAQKGADSVSKAARVAGEAVYEASKDVPGTVRKGAETVRRGCHHFYQGSSDEGL